MNKKGGIRAVLVATLLVFVFGIVYIIFAHPFDLVYSSLTPYLANDSLGTAQKIANAWYLWPIVIVVSLLAMALLTSGNDYYGGE